jgi:hypothetical protein
MEVATAQPPRERLLAACNLGREETPISIVLREQEVTALPSIATTCCTNLNSNDML